MRIRSTIAVAVAALGLTAIPTFARDDRPEARHDEVHDVRPAEHDQREVREVRRDVRVNEHVEVDHRDFRDHDHDRGWDRLHVDIVPAPIFVPAPVVDVVPGPIIAEDLSHGRYSNTPVAIDRIPAVVLSGVAQLTGNAPIVGASYLQSPSAQYYDVRVVLPNGATPTLRFGIYGRFKGYV